MDLRRHITAGRLSELVGRERRRAARPTGWCARSAGAGSPSRSCRCWRRAPGEYLQAYADGVNAYVERPLARRPVGRVLGARPRRRRARDRAVDAGRLAGLAQGDGVGPAQQLRRGARPGDRLRPASATIARVEQLYPPYPADTHAPILPGDGPAGASLAGALRAAGRRRGGGRGGRHGAGRSRPGGGRRHPARGAGRTRRRWSRPRPRSTPCPTCSAAATAIGSNSWVVVRRAHRVRQARCWPTTRTCRRACPSIWYQVGLHCTQVDDACPFDVAGFSFSGLPGVVIGHNADIAWGMTNLGPDVSDFFLEDVAERHLPARRAAGADRDPRRDDRGRGRQRRAARRCAPPCTGRSSPTS